MASPCLSTESNLNDSSQRHLISEGRYFDISMNPVVVLFFFFEFFSIMREIEFFCSSVAGILAG